MALRSCFFAPSNSTEVSGSKIKSRAKTCIPRADRVVKRNVTGFLIVGYSYKLSTMSWGYTMPGATISNSLNTSSLMDVYTVDHWSTTPENESDLLGQSK